MSSLEKWMILTPLQQLPSNVSNLGKIIIATGFKCFSKKQKIAQSGHTGCYITEPKLKPSNLPDGFTWLSAANYLFVKMSFKDGNIATTSLHKNAFLSS